MQSIYKYLKKLNRECAETPRDTLAFVTIWVRMIKVTFVYTNELKKILMVHIRSCLLKFF